MCGINGILSTHNVKKIEARISAMNDSIFHRGPDHGGLKKVSDAIAFGHQRLSIIDLDARSNQPMISNSGNTLIVYNGEVFNFENIKESLKGLYEFKTNCDTEVILAAFEIKGIDWLVNVINGMFAIAIYDFIENKIYLIRDRFGIKPIFYSLIDNNTLIFSSEIKAIIASGLIDPEFNENAIDEYLGNRHVRAPFTFFSNILQVNSASYLIFQNGILLQETNYWTLPPLNFSKIYNEEKLINETALKIKETFERWFISDVNIGSYLSGGVDSSLATGLLSNFKSERIHTYTIGFNKSGYNEFEYAKTIAQKYNTHHHEILMTEDEYYKNWLTLIRYKDAPLAVPNEIPLAIMSSKLKEEITVVVSGEGADELFGGYGRIYRSPFDYNNLSKNTTDFYTFFINSYEYVSRDSRDKYLSTTKNYREVFDKSIKKDFEKHKNEESVFRFFHNFHIKGLLNRVDTSTMQASVEARPPFMDHELIEFVYTKIPYDLKLKWLNTESELEAKHQTASTYSEKNDIPKYILKKVAEKYLPDSIIKRKKIGFPVPLISWLPNLIQMAKKELKDVSWLKQGAVESLIIDIENNPSSLSGQILWMFLNVELFRKEYFQNKYKW